MKKLDWIKFSDHHYYVSMDDMHLVNRIVAVIYNEKIQVDFYKGGNSSPILNHLTFDYSNDWLEKHDYTIVSYIALNLAEDNDRIYALMNKED